MTPRRLGGVAVALMGLSAVRTFSEPPNNEASRQASWRLAADAIKGGGPRPGIPAFVNWRTAREIYPCEGNPGGPPKSPALTRNPYDRDLFGESLHYNPKAAARLCGPLTLAPGAPLMDRALSFWEHANPKPSVIDPPFPAGAELSAAFWNPVRLPMDPALGKIVELPVRAGDQRIARRIRITIPEHARLRSASCGPLKSQGAPATPGVQDVSLDDFFWVQLGPGERYNGATCGDFAVLMAFHLVHKDKGKWLWTTFWWDPDSREFGAGRPRDFLGAGDRPRAWANYAMDASSESTGVIFNPWRIEEQGTKNCAQCHAEVTAHPDYQADKRISFDSVTAARAHFK